MKRALLSAALVLALSAIARPYVTENYGGKPVRWPNAVATVGHDPATITGAYVTELQAALAVWSNISGSAFRFIHGGASQAANVKDSSNGSTDVYFDASLPPYGYAVTMVNQPYSSADISERDVAFNASGAVTWKTSGSGSGVDFRTVAIHELGHVLGLLHESSKTSVMNVTGWDPKNARHSLETDDMDAVQYLYPGTTPGPGPGPGPIPGPTLTADLVVDSVTVTPEDPRPGDRIKVGFTMRNSGAAGTGGFMVAAYLTGGLIPSTTDPLLGSDAEADLAIGTIRTGSIDAFVPEELLPGQYRFGVLADSEGTVAERFETNNGNVTQPLLVIERPALEVGPGQLVSGELGPRGEDRFRMHLPERAVLQLRAQQEPGSLSLDMIRVTQDPALDLKILETGLKRAAKARVKVLSAGEYEIVLRSSSVNQSGYELTLKAKLKPIRGKELVDPELRVPFRVYPGCTVKAVVRGKKKFVPAAEIEEAEGDEDNPIPVVARRKTVRLGPWTATESGERVLVIRPGAETDESEPGVVKFVIRVRPPKVISVVSR